MFNVAGAAPTLAGAATTAAFNLGNTGGPWLGGSVIDAGLGYASPAWAGAAMTALALATVAIALRLTRPTSRIVTRSSASEAPEHEPPQQQAPDQHILQQRATEQEFCA